VTKVDLRPQWVNVNLSLSGSTCSSSSEASLVMCPTTDSDCTLDDDSSLSVSEGAAPKSVIIRKITAEELEDPESPFVKKNISVS
jgi:hypothetical protein